MAEITSPAAALRLAAIIESSDDAIISKDLNGIVTSWNRAAERVFGYTSDEMVGRSITTIVPFDRLAEETVVLTKIRSGEAVNHFETIRRHKDGTLVPISLTVSPIRTPDGTIVGASKIARDLSDRRRAERQLAEAEALQQDLQRRLLALAAGSGQLFKSLEVQAVLPAAIGLAESLVAAQGYAIWRFDSDMNAWTISASVGLSDSFIEQVVPTRQDEPASLVPFPDPLVVEDVRTHPMTGAHRQVYASEGIQSMLVQPLAIRGIRNGTLVFYYQGPHTFNVTELQIAGAIASLTAAALTTAELYDEQKRSRDEAARAYGQANEANRAKDEFLATLSHELRTPLNAVLGWARMLRAGTIPPDRATRALEVIERNADAQLHLVEDMLDLSRIITGNLRLRVQPIAVDPAIRAAVETILPAARAKEISITVDADPHASVMGDPARLQQVVWNLLSNAVKFTPAGGAVTVSLRSIGSTVEMQVADTGEGIESHVLPYVFDRFRQGDSGTTRAQMGLGLGLAIVRHIVEMHGGRVSVRSDGRNQGALFTLSFPTVRPGEASMLPDEKPAGLALPAGSVAGSLVGVRALVVDDDPDAREMMTALLEARGVVVRTAASAHEGLTVLDHGATDIILTDLAMPDQDGYDLIRSVRSRSADSGGRVPAIAVTAYARTEDSTRSLSSGFQIHLTKPIDADALYTAVGRLAAERGRRAAE